MPLPPSVRFFFSSPRKKLDPLPFSHFPSRPLEQGRHCPVLVACCGCRGSRFHFCSFLIYIYIYIYMLCLSFFFFFFVFLKMDIVNK